MFRKSNYVTALGSLFVLLMLAGAAFAIEAPSAEFLRAALVDQLQGASIEVSYDYGFDGKPETVTRFRYLRTQQIQYLSATMEGQPAFAWFDRTARTLRLCGMDQGVRKGLITDSKRSTPLSLASIPDPVLYNLPAGELIDLIGGGTVSPNRENIDGHECWRVDIVPGNKSYKTHTYTVWIDPNVGFCPRLIEERRECVVFLRVSFSDYTNIGSRTWFPMQIRWVTKTPGAEDSVSVARALTARVIPESASQMLDTSFPSGTEVQDRILDAEYVVP